MAKKIKTKPDTDTIPGRVVWYLEKIWRGSMTAMGEDTGIHPSSIGNVIHGRRVPGREILTAIGAHPLVNSDWLLHGTGKPIQTDERETAEIGLPIASRPFAGLPSENPDSLEDVLYPVSLRLHRSSRYWVRMTGNHPFVLDDELKIAAGDIVLFEPEQERWPKDLTGKPCLLAIIEDDGLVLRFGRCTSSKVRCATDVVLSVPYEKHDSKGRKGYHKDLTSIVLHEGPTGQPGTVDVVAVAVYRCGPC